MAFDQAGCLEYLEAFCTTRGARFYGLARNSNDKPTMLKKESWTVDQSYPFEDGQVVPLFAGETITWKRQVC